MDATTARPAPPQPTPARWAGAWPAPAVAAAAGSGAFALSVVVAGALHPGYSHVREAISALAATDSPSAWVAVAGFLALAAGTTAAGATLWVRLRAGAAGRVAAALVVLSGLTAVGSGLARQDCSEADAACAAREAAGALSTHHWVHQYTSLAVFVLLSVALLLLPRALRANPGWAHLATATRLVGLAAVLVIAALMTVGFGDVSGLVQRPFVAVLFGWPVLLAAAPARR
ncbi:DUF998 domain-containing protein [Kineococcus gypseus]|uniref:DUF998 domain-containing protein n=1 Tax=Kineococcus gypseus TaxID=1637102 RepID=UPI003D7CEF61